MSAHPETSDIYFVRHAPVIKEPGHVPPADPPIQKLDYRLEQVASMLPRQARWHVSPLLRAHQTAELLAPLLEPVSMTEDENLAEMDLGEWAERPVAEVWKEIERGPLHNWSFVTAELQPPGGDSFATLMTRVGSWMDQAAASFTHEPQIVITHSGVIRAALAHALHAAPDHAVGVPVPHFGILHLRLMDPGRAGAAGGHWLFAGLGDPDALPGTPS